MRRISLWLNIIPNGLILNGYEGLYKINRKGEVVSLPRTRCKGKIKKAALGSHGYLTISLCKNNKAKTYLLHRLVAETFISNPNNKPDVNHKNGIKTDDRVENLEWCTKSENMKHAVNTGLYSPPRIIVEGEQHGRAKLKKQDIVYILKHKEIGDTELAKKFNVSREHIWLIKKRKSWRCLNEC